MKKKFTFIIILVMLMTSAFVLPTMTHSNDACAKTKYKKVKITTWNKYKKAYKENAELKIQIEDLTTQLKDKKSQVHWLWETLEEFGYNYNYDTHKWEPAAPPIEISQDTLEIEKRGFICISFNGKAINTTSGYYVYADSLVFDPETQTYSGEDIHGSPYKEFYGEDYEEVVDYNYGHQMYLDYVKEN